MNICKLSKVTFFRDATPYGDSVVALHPNGTFATWSVDSFNNNTESCLNFARKGVCSLQWTKAHSVLYPVRSRVYFTPKVNQ